MSTGEKPHGRWDRGLEQKLGITQRARKQKRAQAIHAKMTNHRKNTLHQFSRKRVNENAAVFVGIAIKINVH